jgi:hypothetical protein
MRSLDSLVAVLALFVVASCDDVAPTAADGGITEASGQSELYANSGMTRTTISGTLDIVGGPPPGRVLTTPGGTCHFFQQQLFVNLTGDVEGPVTILEDGHDIKCDATVFIVSGSFSGQVTWNGLTGDISGPIMLSCSREGGPPPPTCVTRVMNATGSGGLDGVLFHFDLQPGWFPFDYAGTVFSK